MIITFKHFPNYQLRYEAAGSNYALYHYSEVAEIHPITGKKTNNPGWAWRTLALYYPNTQQAINGLIRIMRANNEDEKTLEEYIEWYQELRSTLEEMETIDHTA